MVFVLNAGMEESGLGACLGFDIVEAILIPQTEVVVVEAARVALEDAGPPGLTLVDDGVSEVKVVEAGVVALMEYTSGGGISRTNPHVKVSLVEDHAAHVAGDGAINVDLVFRAAVVQTVEQLGVSLHGRRNRSSPSSPSDVFGCGGEGHVRSEGKVGVDLDVLDEVGGERSGLVHLEVQELQLNPMIQGLGESARPGDIGAGREDRDDGSTGRDRNGNHCREEKGREDEHFQAGFL